MAKRTPLQQCVYRIFDRDGRLLYVGCCVDWGVRMSQHARSQPWAGDIHSITIQRFDTPLDAAVEEVRAIAQEHPLHNVDHAPRPKRACGELRRQTLVLFQQHGPMTLTDAANKSGVERGRISVAIQRLVDAGELAVVGSVPSSSRRWKTARVYAVAKRAGEVAA